MASLPLPGLKHRFSRKPVFLLIVWAVIHLKLISGVAHANSIPVPNGSFESPSTQFAEPGIDLWQKSAKPAWYDESGGYLWDQLTGVFLNTAITNPAYIDNMEGNQGIFLFAVPQVAIFQDYDSTDYTNSTPTHSFNAIFEPGKAYVLTVGAIGGGGGMTNGVTLQMSLYYRDAASNAVTVAATSITNTLDLFSNTTHLIDFQTLVPIVKSSDPWAGQHIGIQLLSTVDPTLAGGYWDLDNVRLTSNGGPVLTGITRTNGQTQFTLQSNTNLSFEILSSSDALQSLSNWTSLGTLTNTTGSVVFVDKSTNVNQRFYIARQLP